MRKLSVVYQTGILLLCLAVGSCAKNAGGDATLLLDSFEGALDKQTVDFGAAEGSSLKISASTENKVCGNQSIQLTYDLKQGGYMYCARGFGLDVKGALWQGPSPDKINWASYKAFSFQMYGSHTGTVAFDIKDAGGELWRFLVEDNFQGWKEIVIPFADFKVRDDWQPNNADGNKKLDFPIKSFQWEPKKPGSGVLYFDCVQLK